MALYHGALEAQYFILILGFHKVSSASPTQSVKYTDPGDSCSKPDSSMESRPTELQDKGEQGSHVSDSAVRYRSPSTRRRSSVWSRRFSMTTDSNASLSSPSSGRARSASIRTFNAEALLGVAAENFDDFEVATGVQALMDHPKLQMEDLDKQVLVLSWEEQIMRSPKFVVDFSCLFFREFLEIPSNQEKYSFLGVASESKDLMKLACERSHMSNTLNTLNVVVSQLGDLSSVKRKLRIMGAKHLTFGLKDFHMQCFADGMMYTIRHLACGEMRLPVLRAWYLLLQIINSQFVLGLNRMMRRGSGISDVRSQPSDDTHGLDKDTRFSGF